MIAIWEKSNDNCETCMMNIDNPKSCEKCTKIECKKVEVIQMGCGMSGDRVIIQVGEEFKNVHLYELKPLLEQRYFV